MRVKLSRKVLERAYQMRGSLVRLASFLLLFVMWSSGFSGPVCASLNKNPEPRRKITGLNPTDPVKGILKLFDQRPLVALDEGPHHTTDA